MRVFRTLLVTSVFGLSLAALAAQAAVVTADTPQPARKGSLLAELQAAASAPNADDDATKMADLAKSYGTWGFNAGGMDTSVQPGDDFFQYANGNALKAMQIPGDQPGYGSFSKLNDLSQLQLKVLVTGLADKTGLTGDDQKIADVYKSMMDVARKNQLDVMPLRPDLNRIAAIKTKSQMAAYMGWTSQGFGSAIFGLGVSDDAKKPGFYALQAGQAGLGLPDRDYYLEDSYADKRKAYEAYITDMLRMIAYPDAAKHAHDIVAMETAIAKVSWTKTERRDDTKTYNPMALTALAKYAPGFDWAAFFKGAQVGSAKKVVIAENTAFPKIAKIYAATPLETLKAWEAFNTIDQAAPYLSDRFYARRFEFRSKTMYGIQEQRPLWKRAIVLADDKMGEALGRAYVAAYFPPESKAKMEALVGELLKAMKGRLEAVTWMTPATKAKALEKLSKFGVKIGYPNKWRDYSKLVIKADDLYGNVERSGAFEWDYQRSHIDKPIDPNDWDMTPQTVNAYYSPTRNEIVFPAAILQPPFFDPKADMAVNYGAVGAVIGHEVTHAFDDEGRHYDSHGALKEWWAEADSKAFEARTAALKAQYDTYEILPGVHVKGDQTMGENIADLGGLLVALDAYHLSLKGAEAPVIDGYSGDQRFFLGFGQVWQSKFQDDYAKYLITVDVHSPDHFRPVGTTRNVDAWYKAFNVTGGKYYTKPEDRVKIW